MEEKEQIQKQFLYSFLFYFTPNLDSLTTCLGCCLFQILHKIMVVQKS